MATPVSKRPRPSESPQTPKHAKSKPNPPSDPSNPYLQTFTTFRDALDSHHDRRERLVKTSRDITATSKKLIFSLHRSPCSLESLPQYPILATLLSQLAPDLSPPLCRHRYTRSVSPGLQELVESIFFASYLTTYRLLSLAELNALPLLLDTGIELDHEDYLLGLFDLTGEMMRWGIAHVRDEHAQKVQGDLQALQRGVKGLDCGGERFGREVGKKEAVLDECVRKVEGARAGVVIRGGERPVGWVPALTEERGAGGGGDGE